MFNSDQKRAFLAVLLSGLVLFGWQYFFTSKQIPPIPPTETTATQAALPVANTATTGTPATTTPSTLGQAAATNPITLTNHTLKNGKFSFEFNNDLSVVNLVNPNSVFDFHALTDVKNPLKIQIITDYGPMDLFFQMEQTGPNFIVGKNANYGVTYSAHILENGKVNFSIASDKAYKLRFLFNSAEKKLDNGQVRQFAVFGKDIDHIAVNKAKEEDGTYKWFGIDYNYHLFALVLKDKTVVKYKSTESGQFYVEFVTPVKSFSGDLVFTKKNYDHLVSLGDGLHLSVDFGWFAVLAVPILRGLQFIYKFIPNYGIAIILLTILLRLITFPLQYKSFKSMKKMQTIQPELTALKEKYKDDAQKMQQETMALFKKAGANPLSGCLPLLLQMPFFFAIYRVLYSAVELVGAPFYGWIHDLSIHDPYYILPVLMAGAMFLQQKMTPQTSMDPTQQKIMLFMPIIFGFIMKSLPAGLVLYILVSTLVGLLQQILVYRSVD